MYIRSGEKTRLLCIGPFTQLGTAAILAAGLCWSVHATTAYVSNAIDRTARAGQIEAMRDAHQAEIAAMRTERRALILERDRLQRETATLMSALEAAQRDELETAHALQEARAELDGLRTRLAVLDNKHRHAKVRVAELENAVFSPDAASASAAGFSFGPRVENLAAVSGAMGNVIAERDRALDEADELGERLANAEQALNAWEEREEVLLSRLEDAARTSLAGMSKLFNEADLDLESILGETARDYTGAGGPFAPLAMAPMKMSMPEDARLKELMDDLKRVNLMRIAADRLPFARPVAGARLTSGFGKRRDPMTRRWALHQGLDYAGPLGTPIKASAPGEVVFAGWMRGYGKVLRIRHAFGFETRYAHLSRLHVSKGDHVERGDRIGSMGSTGRSTGSHLHYEVRLGNQPVNPAKFIEAARNVL